MWKRLWAHMFDISYTILLEQKLLQWYFWVSAVSGNLFIIGRNCLSVKHSASKDEAVLHN